MYKRFLAALILVLFSSVASTQEVTVYTECNYTGQRATLPAGRHNVYQMKIPNDRLSAIQIPYGMKVTIYEHENFQGRSRTYLASTPCLETEWRNATSSIVVENENTQPVYNQNDYVTFYNDCYQRGAYQVLRPGSYTSSQLGTLRYNISSFTITGDLRVRLYLNNDNLSGYATDYESGVYCLPESQNDKTGSLVIEYKTLQGVGSGTQPDNGSYATFYSSCDFNGNALRLMPGSYNGAKLGVLKNAIESVQVPANLRVRAYTTSDNLFGTSTNISEDISCLDYNLKDKIASLVVEERYGRGGRRNNNNPNEVVIIYADDNYRGQSASLRPGSYRTMTEAGSFPDNAVSSLFLPEGYRVVLYELENFGGKSFTVTASRTGFFLTSWNDKTSSLVVYKDR